MRFPFQINSCGKNLLGILHTPKKQRNIPIVMIMCYGLNGNRVEQHRMCVKLGEMCETYSINLIRFDYINVGVSEGDFFFSNLSERVKNLIDVYNFILGCFNSKLSLYLNGFSDGAKIILKAKEHINGVDGLIFWNPVINILNLQNHETANDALVEKLKIHPVYKKPYMPFYGSCLSTDIIKNIVNDDSVVLLNDKRKKLFIFGENDINTKHVRAFIERMNCKYTQIKIVNNAEHLFNDEMHEHHVLINTVSWIAENTAGCI